MIRFTFILRQVWGIIINLVKFFVYLFLGAAHVVPQDRFCKFCFISFHYFELSLFSPAAKKMHFFAALNRLILYNSYLNVTN